MHIVLIYLVLLIKERKNTLNSVVCLTFIQRKNMDDLEGNAPVRESFVKRQEEDSHSDKWHLLGTQVPKTEIVYFLSNDHCLYHHHHIRGQLIDKKRFFRIVEQFVC